MNKKYKKNRIDPNKIAVISFSGKKGYGKDYWSDYLVNKYKNVIKVAYADETRFEFDKILELYENKYSLEDIAKEIKAKPEEVKEFIEIYKESNIKYPELNSKSRTNITLRLLQYWGTNVRRVKYSRDYWVNKLFEKIRKGNKDGFVYVISDARFPNEVEAVHKENGLAINISISEKEQIKRLQERDGFVPDITQLSHVSETGLDNYNNFHLTLLTELHSNSLSESILNELIYKKQK